MVNEKQLSQKDRVQKVASELSAIILTQQGKVSGPNNELSAKLSDLGMNMTEYLDLCANTDVINETIRLSIAKHVAPAFAITVRAVAEKAKDGDPKAVDQLYEALGKTATLMQKITRKEEKHLHLHYEKMSPEQLVEENLHQIKQQMKMQIQLPNGYEKLREITAQVFREHSNIKRGLTPKGNTSKKTIEAKIV